MKSKVSKLLVICIFCVGQLAAQVTEKLQMDNDLKADTVNPEIMGDSYLKLWSPELQTRINENIDMNRKGEVTVDIIDHNGLPIEGAVLGVQQETHAFLFGCNAFVLGQLGSSIKNDQYEKIFTRIFNFATVPVYWSATEPQRGKTRYSEGGEDIWRRPPADRFIPFGKKYNLTLKAHPLLWHEHNPNWLPGNPDSLKVLYHNRFQQLSTRYAKDIDIWEVTNESIDCSKDYPLFSENRGYVDWAFKEAAPLFEDKNLMMINDKTRFNELIPSENDYYKQVKELLEKGSPIEGIGFQFHLWFEPRLMEKYLAGERFQPQKMLEVYDEFSKFELPLYITEITVPTPEGKYGEAIRTEVIKNLYRLWFSVPSMAGITYWNLGDSMAYDKENAASSGLVDENMNPKSSYYTLDELINKEWKTNLNLKTDKKGEIQFRGFYGKYKFTITYNGKTLEKEAYIKKSGNNHFIIKV